MTCSQKRGMSTSWFCFLVFCFFAWFFLFVFFSGYSRHPPSLERPFNWWAWCHLWVCTEGLHSACSSAVPCVLSSHYPGASSAFYASVCCCHAPRISAFFLRQKTKQSVASPGPCWSLSVRYRIGLVAKPPPPPLSLYSTLCRSSMTTSAIWKEAFRQHVLINDAFCSRRGPYLLLSPCHVGGLFCIEGVRDASHHKNIQLQLLLALVLVPLQLLQVLFLLAGGGRARAGRTGAAAAAAGRQSSRALAGPARRDAGSGLRCHRLFALLLHYPVRFLLAGRRV